MGNRTYIKQTFTRGSTSREFAHYHWGAEFLILSREDLRQREFPNVIQVIVVIDSEDDFSKQTSVKTMKVTK